MILSRIWYVVLGLVAALAIYAVSLGVGQYNRRTMEGMVEALRGDSQLVNWQLQIDARRRLDALIFATGEKTMVEALRGANGKETLSSKSKEDALKVLKSYSEKLPADYKTDIAFAVDRDGRMVAQVGYDAATAYASFELGGYPAVFDALHGFLRDDVWAWNGQLYRVVARPVEDEPGQPAIGAVVSLRKLDAGFARDLAKRTRTNVAFFSAGQKQAAAAFSDNKDDVDALDLAAATELTKLGEDKVFKETGRSEVRTVGDKERSGAIFTRMTGDAADVGAGYIVARTRTSVEGPMAFIQNADDKDRKAIPWGLIVLVVLGGTVLGIAFSVFEHTLPVVALRKQALDLQKGSIDLLSPAHLRGSFRKVGQAINEGIARVVEKGGGQAKRPANLEAILGPTDAPAQMSAFALPGNQERTTGSVARPGGPPSSNLGPGSSNLGQGPTLTPLGPPSRPTPHYDAAPTPKMGTQSVGNQQAAPALGPPGPPPPPKFPSANMQAGRPAPPPPHGPPGAIATGAFTPTEAPTRPTGQALQGQLRGGLHEDDATMVGEPPADLLEAAGGNELEEWKLVFEEFVRVKQQCNERVDNLTFEKFQQTLTKNRDVLMEQHKCKAVKFTVYVKDGKASLKATPAR